MQVDSSVPRIAQKTWGTAPELVRKALDPVGNLKLCAKLNVRGRRMLQTKMLKLGIETDVLENDGDYVLPKKAKQRIRVSPGRASKRSRSLARMMTASSSESSPQLALQNSDQEAELSMNDIEEAEEINLRLSFVQRDRPLTAAEGRVLSSRHPNYSTTKTESSVHHGSYYSSQTEIDRESMETRIKELSPSQHFC